MKSWRTTLSGALGAAVLVVADLYKTGTVDEKTLVTAAVMAAIGYLAKDAGVTGKRR